MMLVLLLCVIMKIAEFSVGRVSPPLPAPARPPSPCRNKRKQHKRHLNRRPNDKCKFIFQKCAGGGAAVMEDPHTPGSDCNSNPATDPISQDLIGSEFVQDNLEYQWFIDYGYRDGALHTHPSVLSSLSASYNRDDLGYYDDLARNLDANLAEVDMESFRTADIHTLLTALPVMYTDPVQHSESNYQRERYASISGSVMEKLDFDSSISPHTSSQGEDSACSTTDTMSICKSSLLFSPVKETPVLPPGGSYSVDSLDCEDMLLTCQANNKNNYTIAFEGSITMYSDGSQDFENQSNQEKQKTYEAPESYYNRKLGLKNTLNLSMARSDSKIYTTWSNLKRCSVNSAMTRHPSGNNNTIPNLLQATGNMTFNLGKKSQSLPDLTETRELRQANFPLNFSVDSAESNNHAANHQSFGSVMSRSMNEDSSESIGNTSTGKKLQNLSLVKLFMKQKSMSAEGMSLTLDQSGSTSDGGWPTSNSDSTSKTNTHTQILRYNINHTGNDRQPENDFSINWVKGDDYYNNRAPETLAETFDGVPRKRSPPIQEYEEESESSVSVEELSESTSKSDCCPLDDASSKDRKALNSVHSGPEQRPKNAWSHSSEKQRPPCKTTGIQAVAEVEDNGVQTSLVYPAADCPPLRETVVKKKPVYVVYPNYALPDLSFLNSKDGTFENVALKPQCFDKGRTDWQRPGRTGRPFSCNDIDVLKQRGFSHVKDWESLTFLLPTEYKKILQDVPEVSRHIKLNEDGKKPLFCLSPPMRHRTRTIGEMGTNANASSTSSTATQPSSGYRGSSTILTDSSTNQQGVPNNAANPLYLYRYDSVSSEASLVCQDAKLHRPGCQTRTNCPTLPKRSISLPHGEKESNDSCSNGKVPPRPPLPRGILRKKKSTANKRYSMFEIGGVEEIDDRQSPEVNKRMSLQEPYYLNNDIQVLRHGRIIDSEKDVDEMEERYYAERLKDVNRADLGTDDTESNEDIKQLEEYLKRSGFSSQSSDASDDNSDLKLRSYVKRFLALKINKDITKTIDMIDSQKKTVSFAVHQRKKFLDNNKTSILDVTSNLNDDRPIVTESGETSSELRLMNLEEKKGMIRSVSKAVDLLLRYWHEEPIQNRLDYNDKNECSQLCLSNLCPALYAIMSDGLKPQLNTTFGPITNSVWQVVEASSQQGPLTKTLNELVQKINGEDFMTEGMLKFHAFVFGLLNLRALDAWFAYLCTRESILRKHYNSNGLFVDALACVDAREVVDTFLETLQPLALCPFQLDLLYQCRQLHNSFENMTNHAINATTLRTAESPKERALDKSEIRNDITSPKKVRPRSCIAYSNYNDKQGIVHKTNLDSTTAKKRWSNVPINPKLFHAFDKLASEDSEDYTDSLEHSPSNRAAAKQQAPTKLSSVGPKVDETDPISGEIKFRKLQEKWELMTGKDEAKEQILTPSPQSPVRTPTSLGKSKIPRLLTSPVRQPANPITGPVKSAKSPVSGIPALKKPIAITKVALRKSADLKGRDVPGRTSRVDQDAVGGVRSHSTRPSSLPYKCNGVTAKEKCLASPHRRAASTSLPRPTIATASRNPQLKPTLKEVRTLTHRLPSDNGHLSFGEGERLKVILEVDAKWLLCARGESKGLVPRACVHALQT